MANATMFKIHMPSKFVTYTSHEMWIGQVHALNHMAQRDVLPMSMIPKSINTKRHKVLFTLPYQK